MNNRDYKIVNGILYCIVGKSLKYKLSEKDSMIVKIIYKKVLEIENKHLKQLKACFSRNMEKTIFDGVGFNNLNCSNNGSGQKVYLELRYCDVQYACKEIFHKNINWNRLYVFFCFAKILIDYNYDPNKIREHIWNYYNINLKNWVESEGGWDTFYELKVIKNNISYPILTLGLVITTSLLLLYFNL